MRVIGGAYYEEVREPPSTEFYGSGLRAASVLGGCTDVHLHTAVDSNYVDAAKAIASVFKFEINVLERALPVGFRYYTQLSPPTIEGTNQDPLIFNVEVSEPTLVFGMIDGRATVTAPVVIYDPQRPRGPRANDLDTIRADRLAVVANQSEICFLGDSYDLGKAVANLKQSRHLDVVVVKRGPLGATVFDGSSLPSHVGPYRTPSVWAIGSGDVFSAVFSWAWSVDGRSPHDAAELASAATSSYCSTKNPEMGLAPGVSPSAIAQGTRLKSRQEAVRVYLAGPFFCLSQRWLIEAALQALQQQGGEVFSPLHKVGRGGDEVAVKDIEGLDQSEVVFGLLDGADAGTLFELGYGHSNNTPVVGFADDPSLEEFKMLRGLKIPIHKDFATAVYDAIWSAMEVDV